ncbi:hypothetical protein JCM9152_312 [Halalkalibacter hemicellulosilyticusJCM 9152]|uniref:Uncharacterized protein n=2 Tax=Halalkalibacter TaxID=2893056 RepID=W4QBE0_9BACI|nr:hypothetical protein JCM9152_312 [Halalkalibacter hemicellulosilyticusJCM 9152]
MMDFIKRLCIVLGIMAFLGVLFFSTSYTFAAEDRAVPYEWEEAFIWPTVGELTDTFGTRGDLIMVLILQQRRVLQLYLLQTVLFLVLIIPIHMEM